MRPLVENRQGQYLVLRFVLLYVILQLWGLIRSAFGLLVGGVFLGAQELLERDFEGWVEVVFFIIVNLPQVVTWVIVIGIAWPLFRDLNDFLDVDLKSLLFAWRK